MKKEQYFIPTIEVLKFSENNAILTASGIDIDNPSDAIELPDED